ncbi:MAG: amidohydrolase family protein [Planctomycetaceae bacterium]|nr:amidohydrolase family protein [Planctomycetaceae bacterium]
MIRAQRPIHSAVLLLTLALASVSGDALLAQSPTTEPTTGLHQNTPTAHALVGARIVVAPGEVLERGTVVLRDGVIVAVGAGIPTPADARVWDLQGATLYPGLIDAYSEVTVPEGGDGGPGYWNSLIVPQARAEQGYKPDSALNKKYRSQGIVARQILPSAGLIKGTSAVVTTGDEAPRRAVVRAPVALHLEPTIRSRGRDSYPNSPMGAYTLVRQALLDAEWYAQARLAYFEQPGLARPEQNDALEALSAARAGRLPCVIDAPYDLYFFRADRLGTEFGLPVIVRGNGQEYWHLDAVRATGRPVIVPLNFPQPPDVSTVEKSVAASLHDLLHWDIAPENAARLDGAGVTIALTAHGLKEVGGFLAAVRKAVDRGLPADRALRALTSAPAELLGLADRLGAIRPGKSASLVIASGDLFDKKTKILATWVDGTRYEIESVPTVDARGTWEFAYSSPTGEQQTAILVLEGEPAKLTGTISLGEKKAKLTKAATQETQLTGSYKGDDVGTPGMVQFSAALTQTAEGALTGVGEILWPTGERQRLAVKRTAAHSPSPNAKPEQEGEEKKPGSTEPADAAVEPVVKPVGPDGDAARSAGREANQPVVQAVAGNSADAAAPAPAEEPAVKAVPEGASAQPGQAPSEAENPSSGKPAAPANSKPSDKSELAKRRALYPVNYPLGAWGVAAPPEQPKLVLFQHATVWTCGPQGILEDASVLVEAGRIKAVGKEIAPPEGAIVIDLTGKHLTPGIIDCHSHIATDGGVNESAQAITAEVRIGDFIDSNDVNIYRQLAGGVTSSNILHGSANPIGGQNQVIKLRWGALPEQLKFAEAPQGIKFALGENVKQANWGERYTSRYPQTRMGVEQIVRDEFLAAQAYRLRWEQWRRNPTGLPPRTDLELEAIAEILAGQRWIHCHSYRQDEILALMRTCAEFGVQIATLQHILEGYKVADVMAQYQVGGSSFSDWWAYKFEVLDAIPYNGAVMHDAGVVVSFNSDDAELARRLNLEAAKAVKYGGVSPVEALKFVTLNPARQLRIDRWVGSLEPEKHADLVVWSGSPLSNYSHCEASWIDGRKYFDRQADLARRAEVDKMRAALVQRVLDSGEEPAGADTPASEREMWPREDEFCPHHSHRDGHGQGSHDVHHHDHAADLN